MVLPPSAASAASVTHRLPYLGQSATTGNLNFFTVNVKTYDESGVAGDGSGDWAATDSDELWVQDTTVPYSMAERLTVFPGGVSSNGTNPVIQNLVTLGNRAYFLVNMRAPGDYASVFYFDLWVSDGTAAGTHKLVDLDESEPDRAKGLATAGGHLVFASGEPGTGGRSVLWTSDGTEAGTTVLTTDIVTNGARSWGDLALFFGSSRTGQSGLWSTDGTLLGTRYLANVEPTASSSQALMTPKGMLFQEGSGTRVWITDGTVDGTKVAFDGSSTSGGSAEAVAVTADSSYFLLWNKPVEVPSQPATAVVGGATVKPPIVVPEGSSSKSLRVSSLPGDQVSAYDSTGNLLGAAVVASSGTGDIALAPLPAKGARVKLVATRTGTSSAPTYHEFRLGARTAPTAAASAAAGKTVVSGMASPTSTVNVYDIAGKLLGTTTTGQLDPAAPGGAYLGQYSVELSGELSAGTILIVASLEDGEYSEHLWCTPGGSGPALQLPTEGQPFLSAAAAKDGYYVAAWDSANITAGGNSAKNSSTVFKADCTKGTYEPVREPDADLTVQDVASSNGVVFFNQFDAAAPEGSHSVRAGLWAIKSGTAVRLSQDAAFPMMAVPSGMLFTKWESSATGTVQALWFSDGTTAGTHRLKQLDETGVLSDSVHFQSDYRNRIVGGAQWFRGEKAVQIAPRMVTSGDARLWRSDGTVAGTRMIADLMMETTAAPQTPVFGDVPAGAQFHDEITWLAASGISKGWTEADGSTTFRPLRPVNRDAMAAFMYRLAGSPNFTAPAVSPFADVPVSSQFYKEITWLASKGISTGWTEAKGTKTYRPLQPVNRDAMAAFMYRYAGQPAFTPSGTALFADVPVGAQFYKEISWLAARGISTGWMEAGGSKTYRPLLAVNRDAMAAFMFRYSKLLNG
ncbi:S-layer homology domain-containing protein [Arthrobacter bambusae]